MDNQRLLLWASFGMVLFLIYQAWIQDYAPAAAATQPAVAGHGKAGAGNDPRRRARSAAH